MAFNAGVLVNYLKNNFFQKEQQPVTKINDQVIKVIEVGVSGTRIFGGYIHEEYLGELRGRHWADKIDMMKRSDSNVKMAINSLKIPLRSSKWLLQAKDTSEMAKMQKRLCEKALFEDTGKSWKKYLGEILSMIENGNSLFEITYKPVIGDKELGDYNTLAAFSYRSPRTIERWNVDARGELQTVTQIVYGDEGRLVEIDARFLVHFALEQEGDNYQGISVCRPMYGNWLRKDHMLRMLAAGIEKYAIPTPVLSVPPGKEDSPEYHNAEKVLEDYTSTQNNYIIKPDGWDLKIETVNFDPEKLRKAVNEENQEMVNSILAQFLFLGQTKSGSRALGGTLGDFFTNSLIYIAEIISDQIEKKVLTPLIKMNFGDVPLLVDLRCENLADKADKDLSEVLKNLVDSNVLTPDDSLESFIRERYKLPISDPTTARANPVAKGGPAGGEPAPNNTRSDQAAQTDDFSGDFTFGEGLARSFKLSEKKKPKKRQKEAASLIDSSELRIKGIFKRHLKLIGTDFINRVIRQKKSLPASKEVNAAVNVKTLNPANYQKRLVLEATWTAAQSKQHVIDLLKKKKKKLSEFRFSQDRQSRITSNLKDIDALDTQIGNLITNYIYAPNNTDLYNQIRELESQLADLSATTTSLIQDEYKLDYATMQKLLAKIKGIVNTQIADLRNGVTLQYSSTYPSTDSDDTLRTELEDKMSDDVDGSMSGVGAAILAVSVVNESRIDTARDMNENPDEYFDQCIPCEDGKALAEENPDCCLDGVESFTFVAELDENTTPCCEELGTWNSDYGYTFAASDPNVDKYSPPLHYNCRSYLAVNLKSMKGNPDINDEPIVLSKRAQNAINLSERPRNLKTATFKKVK